MHAICFRLAVPSLICLPLILSLGCGARLEPTAPRSGATGAPSAFDRTAQLPLSPVDSQAGFYPLRSGNHWDYVHSSTTEIRPFTGPVRQYSFSATIARDQTCDEIVNGHTYLIERVAETGPNGVDTYWIRFRQDRTGLYEADDTGHPACEGVELAASRAAAATRAIGPWGDGDASALRLAAAMPADQRPAWTAALLRNVELGARIRAALDFGVFDRRRTEAPPAGELLRLSYPLRPGAAWLLRAEPIVFTERVEGIDAVRTPAGTLVGYRISIRTGLLGDRDHVFVWYGRQGFLKLDVHIESLAAVDDGGNVIGTVVTDERHTLTDLALVDPTP